jgi:hypothetical protein
MRPLAPALLSIMMGCPKAAESFSDTMRIKTSVVPAGA